MARDGARRPLLWVVAVLVLIGLVAYMRRTRAPLEPPVVGIPGAPEARGPRATPRFEPSHMVTANGALAEGADAESSDEERYRNRMAETRKALLEKTRYPIGSQPLVTKTDLLKPHHVEPTMRGLEGDPGKNHNILITQNQDRVWISPGQPATATITATAGGVPAQLTISRSALTVQIEDDAGHVSQGPVVGSPTFLDDGNPPDAIASDGVYSAAVLLPATQPPGALVLFVDAAGDDGESGTLLFHFVQTAPPPAIFTQTAHDALEEGSIAIYVGMQVQQAGLYEVVGRLYDSGGLPLVYMRFIGQLSAGATEVRLLAFGKVILDEGGTPPFNLQDIEGNEMLVGVYPDRAPMADWTGPYNLQGSYPLNELSSADYAGEDKQRKLAALNKAEQDGIANIRATPPSATSQPVPGPPSH